MAERYLIASGLTSNPANWFGGNKPGPGDVAHSNGFIGTLDEHITCDTITNAAGVSALVGGRFEPTSGIVITANVVGGGTGAGNCMEFGAAASNGPIHIIGNLQGGSATSTRAVLILATLENSLITIDGDILGGTGGVARGFDFLGGIETDVVITGDLYGGSVAANAQAVHLGLDGGGQRTITINGNIFGGNVPSVTNAAGLNINGRMARLLISGQVIGRLANGIIVSPGSAARDGMIIDVYGAAMGGVPTGVAAINDIALFERTINLYGGSAALGLSVLNSLGLITVHGSAVGGSTPNMPGVLNSSTSSIEIKGSAVGGVDPTSPGILNLSTGPIRIGLESIESPTGTPGVINSGGGDLEIGYLAEMEPAYFPDVKAAEGGKVMVTLLKNSVNASTLVSGTPTVEVFDFESNSVFGEPKDLTLEDGVYSYQHPTNVMTPRKLYYARVEAVIDGEAQDLMERPFVAQ